MSQKKIKNRLHRKDAVQALRSLDSVKQLPELLKQAHEVNQALVEENARLNAEVSNILEEHDKRIETLERVVRSLAISRGIPYQDPPEEDHG